MAGEEKYFKRCTAYSTWHRAESIKRFVGSRKARELSMFDIDGINWIETDHSGKQPLFLVETARDVGRDDKECGALVALAKMAKIPCYTVLYRESGHDIDRFRVKRTHPKPENEWRTLTPLEWAHEILEIRECAENI